MAPVEIKEQFISHDPGQVLALRLQILEGKFEIVSPGLEDWIHRQSPDWEASNCAWLLSATACDAGRSYLLDYNESPDPYPGSTKGGFIKWLNAFNPANCNDWLMVPFLYARHVFDDKSIHWDGFRLDVNPALASLVAPTRGLLLWKEQRLLLIRKATGIGEAEAARLLNLYLRQDNEACRRFDEVEFGGEPLASVFRRLTLNGRYIAGRPDYVLSGKLSGWLTRYERCEC